MSRPGAPIYILDANIWVRLSDSSSIDHATVKNALMTLLASGALLRVLPQTLFEFWSVATRSQAANSLGLSVEEANAEIGMLLLSFPMLPDDAAYVTFWRQIVLRYEVKGRAAHDARYLASMQAQGQTQLLTFDSDFERFVDEGIIIIHPASVMPVP